LQNLLQKSYNRLEACRVLLPRNIPKVCKSTVVINRIIWKVDVIKVIAIAATALAAILVASMTVPALVSAQSAGDFAFRYEKSGGIAGLQKEITYDSKTGILSVVDSIAGNTERMLSESEAGALKDAVRQSGFFDIKGNFTPKPGVADYFSHSLTVTLDGKTHTVSWIDPFASASEVPAALTGLAEKIEKLPSSTPSATPHPSVGKRRISETFVIDSSSHDAKGHSSHQASYLLYPQANHIYSGLLTFSSTRPVDILVYHDVTGIDAKVATHEVNGRSYAVTTMLKNATGGTVQFAGAAVLAHTVDGEPFTVVATVDALRKSAAATKPAAKTFEVGVADEKFKVRVTDSETIQQMTDNYDGKNNYHVTGKLVRGDGGFNQPWSWHLDRLCKDG
jgi:hypothetical protein